MKVAGSGMGNTLRVGAKVKLVGKKHAQRKCKTGKIDLLVQSKGRKTNYVVLLDNGHALKCVKSEIKKIQLKKKGVNIITGISMPGIAKNFVSVIEFAALKKTYDQRIRVLIVAGIIKAVTVGKSAKIIMIDWEKYKNVSIDQRLAHKQLQNAVKKNSKAYNSAFVTFKKN